GSTHVDRHAGVVKYWSDPCTLGRLVPAHVRHTRRAYRFASLALAASLSVEAQAQPNECVSAHADAQLLRMQGSLLAAHEKLLICAQSECPKPVANDCANWLDEVDDSISSVVFAVSNEQDEDVIDVRVRSGDKLITERADGHALPIDPGTYTLRFEAPG